MIRKRLPIAILASSLLLLTGACDKKSPAPDQASAPVAAPATPAGERAPTKAPFLWRIEGQKPSYLYGTIHIPDNAVLAIPKSVSQAVAGCDRLFTEIPMDQATQLGMTPQLMLPEGQNLKQVLPADLYERLDKLFGAKGMPMIALARFKVWAITTQVVLLDHLMEFAAKQPLDAVLYARAQKAGKAVAGLETVAEQLSVFDGLSTEEQISMLRQTLDMLDEYKKKGEDPLGKLVDAYLKGEEQHLLEAMMESFDPEDALSKKLIKRLFDDRNVTMSDRIAAHLKAHPQDSQFFAVGAGHLVGKTGIVGQLTARGFKLERMGAE